MPSPAATRRPRTRSEFDEHFRNIHNELKMKKRKNDQVMGSKKRPTNSPIHVPWSSDDDDDERVVSNKAGKSGEVGKRGGGVRLRKNPLDECVDFERSENSLRRSCSDESVDVMDVSDTDISEEEEEEEDEHFRNFHNELKKKKKKKKKGKNDQVPSSSDNAGEERVVSNKSDKVEKRGRGLRPQKNPLDECVDLERSENSSRKSCSEESVDVIYVPDSDLSEEEEEEDESSDEDYRASSSGEEGYLSSDGDMSSTSSCIGRKSEKVKERVRETKSDDEEEDQGFINTISGEKECFVDEFPDSRNKESEVEKQRDCGVEKECHANLKTVDYVEIDDDFPRINKRARINPKKNGGEMEHKDEEKICSGKNNVNKHKQDSSPAKFCKPRAVSDSKKDDGKFKSSSDEDSADRVVGTGPKITKEETKLSKKEKFRATALDLIKILVASINSAKEHQSHDTAEDNFWTRSTLPLRFGFEDEVRLPHIRSDWEKEIDSLFCDLELGLLETEMDCTDSSVDEMENDGISSEEIDQSPFACCARGDHHHILNEQIGIICKYCFTTILDIKYVLPQFYTPRSCRYDYMKDPDQSPSSHSIDPIQFHDPLGYSNPEPTSLAQGTVWDLIPGVQRELYPHQREGFEFMWNNIAGNIVTEKMKFPLSGGRGCIISHAPGTGKTRLTIVFLQSFLKLYPFCHPVIIAPKGMLLTWESEFVKWKVDIPFHNLNKKKLSEYEKSFAAEIFKQVIVGGSRTMSVECMRLVKLASWVSRESILVLSYQLFNKLVLENGENVGGVEELMKKLLLECPGLLVLDEGHTPRNDKSQIWQAVSKVATQRRIILSGTPFQNNLEELYNTLCIVNPEIESGVNRTGHGCKSRKQWRDLTSSIGKEKNAGLKELRSMLDPLVHVHKGSILEESLPGLRDTLVFLHPTESQKVLLEASSQIPSIFKRIQQVSLISVHPSLMETAGKSLPLKRKLKEIESVEEGIKTKFVMKLIQLADALGERVLVFSQYLTPLEFLKRQIKARFSWSEGRELLYMDGQMDVRQRQDSISSLNDSRSEAKVLLASQRACSEGINLVGASRVVLLDTVWNPSVEKQSVSRAYRVGQKKVVYVYHLFTSGTEVKMHSKHIQKERISQLLFSPTVDGQECRKEKSVEASEDKILEAMLGIERFGHIFEKIISQPKESDLIEIFGLVDQN